MSKLYLLLCKTIGLFLILCLLSCQSNTAPSEQVSAPVIHTWTPPAAGEKVAQWEERITEDQLNESYFRVSVISTPGSAEGHYQLSLEYGFNVNETELNLPKWPEQTVLKPLLKQGEDRYQCRIGFDPGDGIFRPLYLVTVVNKNIRLKQTHQYYHE